MAANSEVTWTDFKKYRDINAGNQGRKNFRERTFKSFEKHFTQLAKSLPEKHVLKIAVTDVDLAGDTNAAVINPRSMNHSGMKHLNMNRTRVVKDIYFPRMTFSYQLVDAEGVVIKSEDVVVKDMNFMSSSRLKYRHKVLGYEKKMLDEWFKDTFSDLITKT